MGGGPDFREFEVSVRIGGTGPCSSGTAYEIFGLSVGLNVPSEAVRAAFDRMWRYHRAAGRGVAGCDIRVRFVAGPPVWHLAGAFGRDDSEPLVSLGEPVHRCEYGSHDPGRSWSISADTRSGELTVCTAEPEPRDERAAAELGRWTAAFCWVLACGLARARGVVMVHASAIVLDGGGVLFTGPTGAGKSVTCLAGVQRGARFLCDDQCPLQVGRDGLELLPAALRIGLAADSTQWVQVPPMAAAEDATAYAKREEKRSYNIMGILRPNQIGAPSRPRLAIFLSRERVGRTTWEELPAGDALREAPRSLMSTNWCRELNGDDKAALFHMVGRLVREVRCIRVSLGADLESFYGRLFETAASWGGR